MELTCDHFDIDSQVKSPSDGLRTVVPWRVKERHKTDELPWSPGTLFPSLWDFLQQVEPCKTPQQNP